MESESLQLKINKTMTEIESLNTKIRDIALSEIDRDIIEDELIQYETHLEALKEQYANLLILQDYQKDCNHIVVEDLIDLTPDKSETVYYCSRCLLTIKPNSS